MDNYIICHYGDNKFIYDFERKKYYLSKKKIIVPIRKNEYIKRKLKKISEGFEWRIDNKLSEILENTYIAHSMRLHYRLDLYQTPILPETAVRRADLVKGKNRRIVLMGDDDLVSIPLALMGHQVTVLDADEYLISLINAINKELELDIKTRCCNFIDEIDSSLKEKFEIMYTDPVSTQEGYEVFVQRGFELLEENGEALIAVTERFRPVLDSFLINSNIKIVEVYKAFGNSYNHKIELIDDVADIIRVKKTSEINVRKIPAQINFFESQKKMRVLFCMELFGIDSEKIDNQLQIVINQLRSSMDQVLQINKYKSLYNNYYFLFADNDDFKVVITIYEKSYVEFNINTINEIIIEIIKRVILNIVSYKEKREESFVCGLPFIKGRVDMDINNLN